MILFPFWIHKILSTLWGVNFSFKASLTCLGTAAVPSPLRRVFMKLDCGVPLVTTISSPSCVHSSFVNFPGVNLSFNNSLTRSGTVVLLPLLRTVVSRSTSFVKSPYMLQVASTYSHGLTWSNLQIPGYLWETIDQALDCRRTEVSSSQGNVRGAWTGSPAPSAREASTSS